MCIIANVDKIILVYMYRDEMEKVCKAVPKLVQVRKQLEIIYNLSNNQLFRN